MEETSTSTQEEQVDAGNNDGDPSSPPGVTVTPIVLPNQSHHNIRNNKGNSNNSYLLLEQAHDAAHYMTLQWIRSTFREICYQLWKDHWKVEHVVVADPLPTPTPSESMLPPAGAAATNHSHNNK